jgi:signal transduction histidine kinase
LLKRIHIRLTTIRARLLFWFVLVALLPAFAISTGFIIVGYLNGRQQALDRIESVTALKNNEIKQWVEARQNELIFIYSESYNAQRLQIVLTLSAREKYVDYYFKALRNDFVRFVSKSQGLSAIFLMDREGGVVLTTDENWSGRSFAEEPFFQDGLRSFSCQYFVDLTDENRPYMISTIPITGTDGVLLGVLAGRASSSAIAEILSDSTGLGKTGTSYLVDEEFQILGTSQLEVYNAEEITSNTQLTGHSMVIDQVIQSQRGSSEIYKDLDGKRVIGVSQWIDKLNLALIVEQDFGEAFSGIFTSLLVNLVVAVITLILAVIISLIVARSISQPVENLANTATRIAAGNLEQNAVVIQEDEIGMLAEAFNSMTAQLRTLINNLEQRVTERTRALQQRALQLETSSQVSREITSILDIDGLLRRIVELMSETFDYYNVHIFFLDIEARQLILKATSATAPSQYSHISLHEKSLNCKAILIKQAILVNDVTLSDDFLGDESFPDILSELVIPLQMSDRLIGTLDVQSREKNAFSAEDLLVLQSLADQIAIAIENARLYERSQQLAVAEERNRLARDLHDSVIQSLYSMMLLAGSWRRLDPVEKNAQADTFINSINSISNQALKEMRLFIHELRPLTLEQEGLLGALHLRLDAVEKRAGIEARLTADDLVRLPGKMEEELYRVALEALNNSLKHSGARKINIHIACLKNHIEMRIYDDGCGCDLSQAARNGGMGLENMRTRVEKIGGLIHFSSTPGEGMTITVKVNV